MAGLDVREILGGARERDLDAGGDRVLVGDVVRGVAAEEEELPRGSASADGSRGPSGGTCTRLPISVAGSSGAPAPSSPVSAPAMARLAWQRYATVYMATPPSPVSAA